MLKHIASRLIQLPLILFVISGLVFLAMHSAPGDPVFMILGPHADSTSYANLRVLLGLDAPLEIQYTRFLLSALRGDLGRSYYTNLLVTSEVIRALSASAELAFFAMIIGISIGMSIGIASAVKQNSKIDSVLRVVSIGGVSMPIFWFGLILIYVFSLNLGWFPTSGRGGIEHLILPSICLGIYPIATIARMTRSCMLDVLKQDYIRTARAKGLGEMSVIMKHGLKNAMIPTITVIGLQAGTILGGAVLTETIFAWPGLGRLLIDSILRRDIPMVQGSVLVLATVFLVANLVVDILYSYFDPRIHSG